MDHPPDFERDKWMEVRRAMIMLLKALDKALGLPPTIPPKEERHPHSK